MKSAILLALLSVPSFAGSQYVGKLDLGGDPSSLGMRDLENGVWRVGLQYPLWHLENSKNGKEVFHVSAYWAARLEGQNPIYGPSVGVNLGAAVLAAVNKFEVLVPALDNIGANLPAFVSKLGDWTSFDIYGGYAPVVGGGDKPWAYGVGGKVVIPLSELYKWAAGTQASGDGVKGL